MFRIFELSPNRFDMLGRNPRDEHALLPSDQLRGNRDDLFRRFARTEDNFGKAFAQGTMRVHLSKAEVRNRSSLKCTEHLFATHIARAELLQKSNGFGCRHARTMPHDCSRVTRELLYDSEAYCEKF